VQGRHGYRGGHIIADAVTAGENTPNAIDTLKTQKTEKNMSGFIFQVSAKSDLKMPAIGVRAGNSFHNISSMDLR
jgi:hypothetical protein